MIISWLSLTAWFTYISFYTLKQSGLHQQRSEYIIGGSSIISHWMAGPIFVNETESEHQRTETYSTWDSLKRLRPRLVSYTGQRLYQNDSHYLEPKFILQNSSTHWTNSSLYGHRPNQYTHLLKNNIVVFLTGILPFCYWEKTKLK